MSGGYLLATRILENLCDDKRIKCLGALMKAEQGQAKLSSGDWNAALTLCMAAHDQFAGIPEAQPLLCIVKTDIAAAYGNLGRTYDSKRFAEDALPLLQGVTGLARTEAAARMTAGVACYLDGDAVEGAKMFDGARQLLRGLPGAEEQLRILESNEANLRAAGRKKWWKPW